MNNIKQKLDELTQLVDCVNTLENCTEILSAELDFDKSEIIHTIYIMLKKAKENADEITHLIGKKAESVAGNVPAENIAIQVTQISKNRSEYNAVEKSQSLNTTLFSEQTDNKSETVEESNIVTHETNPTAESIVNTELECNIEVPAQKRAKEVLPEATPIVNQETKAKKLSKPAIVDLNKLSIADRFKFNNELFNGNGEKMAKTLSALNDMTSLQEAIDYLSTVIMVNKENTATHDFIDILKRKFG